MTAALYLVSASCRAVLSLFEGWHPLASLTLISILTGIGMLWVFRRVSNQAAIRRAKSHLQAHLYELRLYADEPVLIWRAQRDLLAANLRYLRLMLKPAVILTIPMVLALVQLDAFYGRQPLEVGAPALVTVQMKEAIDPSAPPPALEVPDGFAVESPAVRALAERQVVWRVRPVREALGVLRVRLPGGVVEKDIVSGGGPRYLTARRASSRGDVFWDPGERAIEGSSIDWIEVAYPPAEAGLWSFRLHWLVWFVVISLAAAWLLKGRFGVAL